MSLGRPALFLDRDGVLNTVTRGLYVTTPAELVLLHGVAAAVRRLNDLGVPVVIATNQQGVGKGVFTEDDLAAVHTALRTRFAEQGARLTEIYCCPHRAEWACECRKPRPGLFLRAAAEHGIDLARSWFVGDTHTDAAAARAAGLGGFCLVLSGVARRADVDNPALFPVPPDHIADDLTAAVAFLAAQGTW